MDLTLVRMWNGLPIGFKMVGVQLGQAELMIRYGTAVATAQVVEVKHAQHNQQRDKAKRG